MKKKMANRRIQNKIIFFFRRGFQNQLREGDSNQVAPLSVQSGSNRCGNLHSLDQAHQVLNSYPAVPVKKLKTKPPGRMRNRVYRSQTPHRGLSSLPQTEYARVAPPLSTSPSLSSLTKSIFAVHSIT